MAFRRACRHAATAAHSPSKLGPGTRSGRRGSRHMPSGRGARSVSSGRSPRASHDAVEVEGGVLPGQLLQTRFFVVQTGSNEPEGAERRLRRAGEVALRSPRRSGAGSGSASRWRGSAAALRPRRSAAPPARPSPESTARPGGRPGCRASGARARPSRRRAPRSRGSDGGARPGRAGRGRGILPRGHGPDRRQRNDTGQAERRAHASSSRESRPRRYGIRAAPRIA